MMEMMNGITITRLRLEKVAAMMKSTIMDYLILSRHQHLHQHTGMANWTTNIWKRINWTASAAS